MSLRVARNRIALGAAAVTLVLSACATGPRPSLVQEPVVTDTVAQAVLDRLERGATATFTADYDIIPSQTGQVTHATVMQLGAQQRVTIGDVDYFTDGTVSRTCAVGGTDCVDSIDEARISNLSVTSKFWGPSVASKLELDSARSVDVATVLAALLAPAMAPKNSQSQPDECTERGGHKDDRPDRPRKIPHQELDAG